MTGDCLNKKLKATVHERVLGPAGTRERLDRACSRSRHRPSHHFLSSSHSCDRLGLSLPRPQILVLWFTSFTPVVEFRKTVEWPWSYCSSRVKKRRNSALHDSLVH